LGPLALMAIGKTGRIVIVIAFTFLIGVVVPSFVVSTPVNALEQCKTLDKFMDFQSHNFSSPNNVEFIIYANVTHKFHLSFDALLRVGIPGKLGYKCTFYHDDQNPKLAEYDFPAGSFIPEHEFFTCVDNLQTGEDNCETHRYRITKNPEIIDLRLRNRD
jgi:hypothetical protein